jgi:HlyD family secretion protein
MKSRKKWVKRGILIGLALIAAGIGVLSLVDGRRPRFTSEIARIRDIETFFTFTGNIVPDQSETVYAAHGGKISKLYYEEGETVHKEDSVMRSQSGQLYEAPIHGTLTDIFIDLNDTVKPGDALFRVASYDKPVVMISIDEYDIDAISAGEDVRVYVQAMDKTVAGVIEKVDREATVTGNVAYYGAKVVLIQDGSIRMGMTCEVSVPKQSAIGATTIALKSVKFDEDNRPFVYMYDRNDDVVAEYVALGVTNGTYVEVTEGLKAGETILIPQSNASMFMSFQNMRFR